MSKWTNLLLDVNYMKQYAKNAARVVTINIAKFGEVDEDRAKDAVMARFWLDKLLLDESDLIEKWGQPVWELSEYSCFCRNFLNCIYNSNSLEILQNI